MTAKLQTTQSTATITRTSAGTSFVLLMNWTRRRYLLRPGVLIIHMRRA